MMGALRIACPCPSSRLPAYVLPVRTSLLLGGRERAISLGVLLLGAVPPVAGAQGLPAYRPINPILASRSALGFQPLVAASPRWRVALALDWANSIDFNSRPPAAYSLDGEFMRLEATISHDIGPRLFAQATLGAGKALPGFLDPFVSWWHHLYGISESRREERPENDYEFRIRLRDGTSLTRPATGLYVTDARLTFGVRHSPRWQTALTVALPTSNAPDGYALHSVAAALSTTYRSPVYWNRLTYEGSAGVGYTPAHGDLASWQHEFFYGASSGARLRAVGKQSVYANLILHSPGYRGTALPSIDGVDLSLDFGFLLKPGGGPEITAGLVEDLYSFGPAVDLVFRLAARW
jgi:hypothetical protein